MCTHHKFGTVVADGYETKLGAVFKLQQRQVGHRLANQSALAFVVLWDLVSCFVGGSTEQAEIISFPHIRRSVELMTATLDFLIRHLCTCSSWQSRHFSPIQ